MDRSFRQRIQAFDDAVRFKKNEYVPYLDNDGFWRYYDSGYLLSEALKDYDKAKETLVAHAVKYNVDTFLDIGDRNPLQMSEALGNKEYLIDDKNNTLIVKEQCHMDADGYDLFVQNPVAFLWEHIMVHKYSGFNKDMTQEQLQNALGKFLEWNQQMDMFRAALKEIAGIPPIYDVAHGGGAIDPGVEVFYGMFRGMKGLSQDLRRCPEKVKAASHVLFEVFMRRSVDALIPGVEREGAFDAGVTTLCANLLSRKQFEDFFWPECKIITDRIVETDKVLYFLSEGTTNHIEDLFADLEKGHFCLYVESDDIFKKRKALPGICLQGGIPLKLLGQGKKDECIELTKRLIEEVGENGGLIVSPEKFTSNPKDCNADNLKAVVMTAHGEI